MMPEFTVKEFAAKERVTPRTVRTWIAKGAVHYRRTPGGGVRILVPESRAVVFRLGKDDEEPGSPSR